MADNVVLNTGSGGDTIAADDVSGVKYQVVKLAVGADGVASLVGNANPVPISDAGSSLTVDGTVAVSGTVAVTDNGATLSIDDGGDSLTVDGTVELGAASLAALENITVSGTVQIGNTPNTTPILASIHDGATKASVADLTNSNPLHVAIVDGSGNQVTSFGGTGGTSATDDAPFTAGTTPVTPVGGIVSSDSVDAGDVGAFAMLANRQQKVTLYDSSGNELAVGGGTQYTEDAAAAANPVGNALIVVRDDSRAGSLTSANGDNVALRGNNIGELYVKHTDAIPVTDNGGSLTVDNGGTFAVQATLAAETTKVIGTVNIAAAQTVATVTTVSAVTAITNALPAGTNAIGKLAANSGVDIGDVDVTTVGTITPGTGATNLGKAEDAAHTSGDVGVLVLGVRRDADTTPVSADGDYHALQFDNSGNLKVNIKAGAGSGGTASTDDAAFTAASGSGTPIMGFATSDAVDSGDVGVVGMTTNRELKVSVTSGGIAGIAEDSASAGGEDGVMVLAVRRDTPSSGVSADGDFAALSVDSNGALRVTGAAGTTQYTEDGASAGGESLCLAGAIRQDTLSSSTSADGDYAALKVTAAGRLYASTTVDAALPAGTNNIGDVDVLTVPTDPFGANADAASATGSISAKLRFIASTGVPVTSLPASTNTLEVVGDVAHDAAAAGNPVLLGAYASAAAPADVSADGDAVRVWALRSGAQVVQSSYAGVLATTGNGAAGAGVQRVTIASDSTGQITSIGSAAQDAAIAGNPVPVGMRASTATPTAMSADGDVVYPWATREGAQVIAGAIVDDAAFTPGTSRVVPIGFQADESSTDSVDEGDAGTPRMTLDRKVITTPYVHAAAGGATPYKNLDCDESEDDIKTSPGKLFWVHAINLANAKRYLKFYNATAANVTVGTTTPVLSFPIPTMGDTNGAGFCINFGAIGVQFDTAISVAATTGFADNDTGAPGANEIILNAAYA